MEAPDPQTVVINFDEPFAPWLANMWHGSIAFVMVQFSATAYSPRLVLWLARSSVINHSIGLFTATFVYSLAAAAWVNRDGSGLTPPITVWFAVMLLLGSVALFVMLVERVGMLQVTRVLGFAGNEGRAVIEKMYPTSGAAGRPRQATTRALGEAGPALPPVSQTLTQHGAPAVVQAIDEDSMVALPAQAGGVIVMALAVGDTVREPGGSLPSPDGETANPEPGKSAHRC